MGLYILQWNARSLYANANSFKNFLDENEKPDVICIQETHFQGNRYIKLNGYQPPVIKNRNGIKNNKGKIKSKGGGVAVYVSNLLTYTEIDFQAENIEITGVTINCQNDKINIVNMYRPPDQTLNFQDYTKLFNNINQNLVLLGDYNARSSLWGSIKTDKNGQVLEDLIQHMDLIVLNDGSGTRLDNNGNTSEIDLTFVSPSLTKDSQWAVLEDPLGSDHFPILTVLKSKPIKNEVCTAQRWIYDKANWHLFSKICQNVKIQDVKHQDINIYNSNICQQITSIADAAIPKTKGKVHIRKNCPWWNTQCTEAKKVKRNKLRRFDKTKNSHDLDEYKQALKTFKNITDKARKEYFQDFCSKLNHRSNVKQVWQTIKNMKGTKVTSLPTLVQNQKQAVTNKQKANLLAMSFAEDSSDQNLEPEFKLHKEKFEKENPIEKDLNPDNNKKSINKPFTKEELLKVLKTKKTTAPGDDRISYEMFKHMPDNMINIVLDLINQVWDSGQLPSSWKNANVIPILKPNKNKSDPKSYRPISLTSNFCKLMESMVNERLKYIIEKNNIIKDNQSGFRKGRSTIDHLIRLETEIQKAKARNQYLLAVFLDIEKAFDLVWRKGLLYKIKQFGISGNMFNFISDFLQDRKIQVKVNNETSDERELQNGTPQGSVISPTLFNILIDDLVYQAEKSAKTSQFADDSAMWHRGHNLKILRNKMQRTLDNVSKWAIKWGFKISKTKTIGVIFGNRKVTSTNLTLGNQPIKFENHVKFLGLIFDRKLTWKKHFDYLEERSKPILNLMRYVQANNFGMGTETLIMLYKSLLRSILDYGCQVFNSASNSLKLKLDKIQYKGLRIALGALTSTPVENLLVEAGEKPLQIRRDEFSLKYYARCSQNQKNPAKETLEDCVEYRAKSQKWKNDTIPFGYRVRKELTLNKLDKIQIVKHNPPTLPPWIIKTANTSCELKNKIDKGDDPNIIKTITLEHIDSKYKNFEKIYTDGSKDPITGKTACAFTVPKAKYVFHERCTDNISVYTTEMIAIFKALKWIVDSDYPYQKVVILTDSLSAIQSIDNNQSSRPDILEAIQMLAFKIRNKQIELIIEWIPAHVGILGNELADKLAKAALKQENININIAYSTSEFYAIVKNIFKKKWQDIWDTHRNSWYYRLNPSVNSKPFFYLGNRNHSKTLTRLRLGTTLLPGQMGQHIKNISPLCSVCNTKEDIEHVILHCVAHNNARIKLNTALTKFNINTIDIKILLDPPKEFKNQIYKELVDFITEIDYHKCI